jgi:small glutamine-rich tetratricopeptide repeat-containing protein alpha
MIARNQSIFQNAKAMQKKKKVFRHIWHAQVTNLYSSSKLSVLDSSAKGQRETWKPVEFSDQIARRSTTTKKKKKLNLRMSNVEFVKALVVAMRQLKGAVDQESLDVAQDCLASAFDLGASGQIECSISLLELFERGSKSAADNGAKDAEKSSDNDDGADERFQAYISLLGKRGYFGSSKVGTAEYKEKYAKARRQYEARFSSSSSSSSSESGKKQPDQETIARANALKEEANKMMSARDFAGALEKYSAAIEVHDGNAIFWANRAMAHQMLKNVEAAIGDAQRAIDIDPTYLKGYVRLGRAYFSTEQYQLALDKGFKPLLEREPSSADAKAWIEKCNDQLSFDEMPPLVPVDGSAADAGASIGETTPTGMPDLGGLDIAGLMQNPEAMQAMMNNPQIQAMMNNPQMAGILQQVMSNPEMLQQMLGGLGGQ